MFLKASFSTTRLRYLLAASSIALSVAYGWAGRAAFHDIDGISYFDMGDAYLRGDWTRAVNGLWSPFYGVVVSTALRIINPAPSQEFLIVHLVGLAIYIVALLSFDFLWSEFGLILRERSETTRGVWITFPQWAWYLLGYSLFLWVSLQLITVLEETPDMLLSAAVYLATAFVLRISHDRAKLLTFVMLGLVLGLGYLTKMILFPLSLVFLGVAATITYKKRRSLTGPAISALVFLLIASPLVIALSHSKGRLTVGDSGKINYLWHVDGVRWMWWLGDFPGYGSAHHPPRMLLDKPRIYEFATPFTATFPPWYDPSYWYDGMNPQFDLRKQARAFVEGIGIYHGLFLKPGIVLIVVSLILFSIRRSAREVIGRLDVLLPSVSALVLYALVHVEPRYVGCFFLIFWGGVLCQVRLPKSEPSRRLLMFSALAIVVVYSIKLGIGVGSTTNSEEEKSANMRVEVEAAQDLLRAGLKPGDRVAVIGGITGMVWARLDKLRVVSSSPEDADGWIKDSEARSRALSAFAATGARAVISGKALPPGLENGWTRIGQTSYYLYGLTPLKPY